MAGPWFAVTESDSEWTELGTMLITGGGEHERARVEFRVKLAETKDVETK